jgi:hypothetical protein
MYSFLCFDLVLLRRIAVCQLRSSLSMSLRDLLIHYSQFLADSLAMTALMAVFHLLQKAITSKFEACPRRMLTAHGPHRNVPRITIQTMTVNKHNIAIPVTRFGHLAIAIPKAAKISVRLGSPQEMQGQVQLCEWTGHHGRIGHGAMPVPPDTTKSAGRCDQLAAIAVAIHTHL